MESAGVEEIKMYAGLLHTHLVGSAIRVRHFRGDKELPIIQQDDSYDFNFQEVRTFKEELTVKKVTNISMNQEIKPKAWREVKRSYGPLYILINI